MSGNGRHVVYAELTPKEHAVFEDIRAQEDCSVSDLIRLALNELAEQYDIPDAFPLKQPGRPKRSA